MIFESSHPILSDHEIKTIDGLSHVVGDPSRLRFTPGSTVTIHSWGSEPFSSMELMFNECEATLCEESPIFSYGCSLKGMLRLCLGFDQDLRWNTSNVTNMAGVFFRCRRFNQCLLWDTSNVTDMSYMFDGCTSLRRSVSFNTPNVGFMTRMFANCWSMVEIPLLDTSNVADMNDMFTGCDRRLSIHRASTDKAVRIGQRFD